MQRTVTISVSSGGQHRKQLDWEKVSKSGGRFGAQRFCALPARFFMIPQSQVQLARSVDDFMFCAGCYHESTSWDGHATWPRSFKSFYGSMPHTVMSTPERSLVWNDGDVEVSESFVWYSQVFSANTSTTLKSTVVVAYPGHVLLLNFPAKYHHWLVENGHTVVFFQAVRLESDLKDICYVHGVQSSVYCSTGTWGSCRGNTAILLRWDWTAEDVFIPWCYEGDFKGTDGC